MKRTIFSPCELRTWLDTHEAKLKAAVLAEVSIRESETTHESLPSSEVTPPLLARSQNDMASGRDFIAGYLDKAGIGFDPDDYDCQRVIAVAGSWVTRWRLGYE
jgi:hypothetical protein